MTHDFRFSDHGSIWVLSPRTMAAEAWVDEHIEPDALRWAAGVVVEYGCVDNILSLIARDGLTVEE